jgi:hypothetical protein
MCCAHLHILKSFLRDLYHLKQCKCLSK